MASPSPPAALPTCVLPTSPRPNQGPAQLVAAPAVSASSAAAAAASAEAAAAADFYVAASVVHGSVRRQLLHHCLLLVQIRSKRQSMRQAHGVRHDRVHAQVSYHDREQYHSTQCLCHERRRMRRSLGPPCCRRNGGEDWPTHAAHRSLPCQRCQPQRRPHCTCGIVASDDLT